jgi:hypothetical protein
MSKIGSDVIGKSRLSKKDRIEAYKAYYRIFEGFDIDKLLRKHPKWKLESLGRLGGYFEISLVNTNKQAERLGERKRIHAILLDSGRWDIEVWRSAGDTISRLYLNAYSSLELANILDSQMEVSWSLKKYGQNRA